MSEVTGIQGQKLEVRVVGCNKLKNTEWLSRQDPYVSIEYGSFKFLSSICIDGGTNPTFQDKFLITLVEGLRELNVAVWNSNTFAYDNLIGSGRIQLQKVLTEGFDDTAWTIQSKSCRYAGEVCLIMHYSNTNKPMTGCAPSAPPPPPPPQSQPQPQPQPQQVPPYYAPPPAAAPYPPTPLYPPSTYPPQPAAAPCPHVPLYPPSPYPPQPAAAPCPHVPLYPPSQYPPQPAAAYPPQPSIYPPSYPPQAYAPKEYPPQGYLPYGCVYVAQSFPADPNQAYPPKH